MLTAFSLSEPTSALDAMSTQLVEQSLTAVKNTGNQLTPTLIWVTHSQEQADRVATRRFYLDKRSTQPLQSV